MRPRIELDRIASVVYASGDVNDTLRQGMMRTALRYYPQAAARAPVTIPVAQNMVFTGFISPMILGGRDMEEKPAQPVRVSVPMNKSPIPSPKDLYGGYPAVTLGAAGCVKGTVQGFVPGGTLKSVPITAVSPVVEKDQEPFDASKWVFTFPETADIKAQVKSPGNSFNLQAAAGKAEVSNDGLASGKGKAKETLVATGEESRIATDEELVVAPPPMLGIRSAHEHQMAFIKFMKQKNRSPSITPQKKENKATSFTPGEVETIVGNGATW
ncbi:hypothetical protein FN846DRAFT_334135 [Sphaerosporella brunnea]|uniref:Uncharacterized protein n=1 Tax=Sphaerosporella brunnea TaxID=1250544 RepID=A0A5J5EKJ3_9PEZI|nr:hypothetical protein FN846DRAFT_333652 [Sphaerosporella brunnea]KAA8895501.1 hypothetical protein FN846DRAFT_334135 [Sphaerosporella brunnea]